MAGFDTMAMIVLAINLGIWLAILIGIVALQVFLSRRRAWWPGLILPGCALLGALFLLPNVILVALSTTEQPSSALGAALGLTLCLLPTLVLTVIYLVCRRRDKEKRQIDKMNIQDL